MSFVNQEQLDQIRERAERATPGPWEHEENRTDIHGAGYTSITPYVTQESDAVFIAHAREDVPRLLATIDQQRDQIADLEVALKEIQRVAVSCEPGEGLAK